MKFSSSTSKQSGITLVDVIVATGIISIMSLGVIGSMSYGFFVMQMARENQRATQILLEKVETMRLYSWDQVNSNGFIPASFSEVYDPQASFGQQGVTYSGTLTIDAFTNATSGSVSTPPTYATNMRQVTLTLNWNTRSVSRT